MKFFSRQNEPLSLNITPLIDVVFLLLIFFMVTTTFNQNTQLEVNLPGIQARQTPEQRAIEVSVSAQGQYMIEGKLLRDSSMQSLQAAIREHANFDPSQKIILAADASAPHQMVVRVMDVAGQLGYQNIQILGDYDG